MNAPVREKQLDLVFNELARQEAARTSLAGFVTYQLGKTPEPHHLLLCDAVDRLLADEYDDLILLLPPNTAKSFYTSVAIPPYLLGKVPNSQILAISGTADLAQQWGRLARNNIKNPSIRTVFPDLELAEDSRATDNFSTTAGGTYRSYGVNSQVLGQRATILLIDDPLTSATPSLPMLQQLHSYYENEALTRLDPRIGKVILVCQRLDRNDLAGYMIDRNDREQTRRLKVVTLKMETEEGDEPDGTNRKPGEILWPERFTYKWVADAKRNPYKWQTLYQQSPPSDVGQWCRPEWLLFVDSAPADVTYYLCSDLALSVGKGDYSVHIVVGVDSSGRLYIVYAWRERCTINETVTKHLELLLQYSPMESLIDDDNASKVYGVTLADRARYHPEGRVIVPWKIMPIRGQDKETRAAPLRGLLQQGRVFLIRAPWNNWLMKEMLGFPILTGPGVDDGVDALSLIGRRQLQLGKPAGAPPPPKEQKVVGVNVSLDDAWLCLTPKSNRI